MSISLYGLLSHEQNILFSILLIFILRLQTLYYLQTVHPCVYVYNWQHVGYMAGILWHNYIIVYDKMYFSNSKPCEIIIWTSVMIFLMWNIICHIYWNCFQGRTTLKLKICLFILSILWLHILLFWNLNYKWVPVQHKN